MIKVQAFNLTKSGKLKRLIRRYHAALIYLLNREAENARHPAFKQENIPPVHRALESCLDELLSFLEERYNVCLCLFGRAPVTYLSVSKAELNRRVKKLEQSLLHTLPSRRTAYLLFQYLYAFTAKAQKEEIVTYEEILYMKALVGELESLNPLQSASGVYTSLDELLIYLNFNAREYIHQLTHDLAEKINEAIALTDKLDKLLFYFKAFKQLQRKPNVVYDPQLKHLKTELGNWFRQELHYLKQKLRLSVLPLPGQKTKLRSSAEKQKITCSLSADQIAIMLRALEELKIINARSLNDVFRNLIPYLSTPHRQELSYESVRSKAYKVETRDQQKVVKMLQEVIEKVNDY